MALLKSADKELSGKGEMRPVPHSPSFPSSCYHVSHFSLCSPDISAATAPHSCPPQKDTIDHIGLGRKPKPIVSQVKNSQGSAEVRDTDSAPAHLGSKKSQNLSSEASLSPQGAHRTGAVIFRSHEARGEKQEGATFAHLWIPSS